MRIKIVNTCRMLRTGLGTPVPYKCYLIKCLLLRKGKERGREGRGNGRRGKRRKVEEESGGEREGKGKYLPASLMCISFPAPENNQISNAVLKSLDDTLSSFGN